MTLPPIPHPLIEALSVAQRFGALGQGSVETMIQHARVFVAGVAEVEGRVIDLGTGGGVPGLVLAIDRPDLMVDLVDRRQARTDLCERLVSRLGVGDRVRVVNAEAKELARRDDVTGAAAVVARAFGDPMTTVTHAVPLVAVGGPIVVSEPPEGDRWDETQLGEAGVVRDRWVHAPLDNQGSVMTRAMVLRRVQ